MPKGDISQIIKRIKRISQKSSVRMRRSPFSALQELPPGRQIIELKKAAGEMAKIHRAAMRLATGR